MPTKSNSSPKSNLTIRISDDLRSKLEKQATEENRSLANLITKILLDYLEKQTKQT